MSARTARVERETSESKVLVEVNLKAAAAIGVTVPEPFVASADRVIR